jgi:glycosyltransferase involved in cell wall biosynthesis
VADETYRFSDKPRSPMKVSIITPSLNQAQFIERTIQSVLAQQWRPLEHIVLDGGSTDGTLDILKKYGAHLRWISEPDKGQSDAVNKGIKMAAGDVVGWLNSDDIYYPGAVKLAAEFLAAHPELDAVYGMADYVAADDSVIDGYPTEPWHFPRLKDVCFICQPALFLRRSVFERHGYLDTDLHYCMDYEYFLRLGGAGVRFGYLETKLAGARMYVGNKTISGRIEAYAEVIEMFRRNFGRVPDSWLFGYAHVIAKQRTDINEHPTRFLFEKGLRSLGAALRWNRSVSPGMTYRLLRGIPKKLLGRGEKQVSTIGSKPSWWWN